MFSEHEQAVDFLQVSQHSEAGDMWMIIDGKVYDVSQFALSHPGGSDIIFRVAGTDATQEFLDIHPPEYAWEYVGPAIGAIVNGSSPSSSVLPKAGLSVKLAEAESFGELREALQSRILTITGGFGAMVQRYMREQVRRNHRIVRFVRCSQHSRIETRCAAARGGRRRSLRPTTAAAPSCGTTPRTCSATTTCCA